MLLHNPFEEMIMRVGMLEVPPGIGALVMFTDGQQTKGVWQGVSLPVVDRFLQMLTQLRESLAGSPGGVPPAGSVAGTKN